MRKNHAPVTPWLHCAVDTRGGAVISAAAAQTAEELCARCTTLVRLDAARDDPSSPVQTKCQSRDAAGKHLDVLAQHLAVVWAVGRYHQCTGYTLNEGNVGCV